MADYSFRKNLDPRCRWVLCMQSLPVCIEKQVDYYSIYTLHGLWNEYKMNENSDIQKHKVNLDLLTQNPTLLFNMIRYWPTMVINPLKMKEIRHLYEEELQFYHEKIESLKEGLKGKVDQIIVEEKEKEILKGRISAKEFKEMLFFWTHEWGKHGYGLPEYGTNQNVFFHRSLQMYFKLKPNALAANGHHELRFQLDENYNVITTTVNPLHYF